MSIGSIIKFQRKTQNLTQEVLCQGICSITYLSKVENEVIEPSKDILELICKRLSIDLTNMTSVKEFNDVLLELLRLFKEKGYDRLGIELTQNIKDHTTNPKILVVLRMVELKLMIATSNVHEAEKTSIQIDSLKSFIDAEYTALYFHVMGIYEYSTQRYENSLAYFKRINDENTPFVSKEDIDYHLGLVYSRLNQNTLSIFYISRALEMYSKKLDYVACINCHLLLGISHLRIKEFESGKTYFLGVLETATRVKGFEEIKGKALHNLGIIESELNHPTKAIHFFKESLLYKSNSTKINTYYLIMKEYIKSNNWNEAMHWYMTCKNILKEYPNEKYQIKLTLMEPKVTGLNSAYDYQYLTKVAIPFFEESGDFLELYECKELLAIYYMDKFLYKQANKELLNMLELMKSYMN